MSHHRYSDHYSDELSCPPWYEQECYQPRRRNIQPVAPRTDSWWEGDHRPRGGSLKVFSENSRARFKRIQAVTDHGNFGTRHVPSGGTQRVFSERLHFDRFAEPRVDAHWHGGHEQPRSDFRIEDHPTRYDSVAPRTDCWSDHTPKGGQLKVFSERPRFAQHASARVDDGWEGGHSPARSHARVFSERLCFTDCAEPRVDAWVPGHHPGGGTKRVFSEPLPRY